MGIRRKTKSGKWRMGSKLRGRTRKNNEEKSLAEKKKKGTKRGKKDGWRKRKEMRKGVVFYDALLKSITQFMNNNIIHKQMKKKKGEKRGKEK